MEIYIIYDSYFGNTRKVAEILAAELSRSYNVQLDKAEDFREEKLKAADIFIAGSPTRGFTFSARIKHLLGKLPAKALKGKQLAAFDTRVKPGDTNSHIYKHFAGTFGYAAGSLQRKLIGKKGQLLLPSRGFAVEGKEGPLKKGEEEGVKSWAAEINMIIEEQKTEPESPGSLS
ncbi:MAG: flavodoxin family protein [Bacteroidota bacterium]